MLQPALFHRWIDSLYRFTHVHLLCSFSTPCYLLSTQAYDDAGTVRVYGFNGNYYELQAEIVNWTESSAAMTSHFGQSCSLDRNGSTLIVGAPGFSPSEGGYSEGGVFIYHNDNGVWDLELNFTAR